MSGSAPASPPEGARPRERLVALFAAVLWVAATTALFGFLSLLLDLDVIREEAAGPLLGPAMVLAAALLLGARLARDPARGRGVVAALVGGVVVTGVAMLLVGAVGYAIVTADPAQLLFFPARYIVSPFLVGAALLGGLTAVAARAVSSRAATGGRPRWPWEGPDEP